MRTRQVIAIQIREVGSAVELELTTTDGEHTWIRRYEAPEPTALHAARCLADRYGLAVADDRRWAPPADLVAERIA